MARPALPLWYDVSDLDKAHLAPLPWLSGPDAQIYDCNLACLIRCPVGLALLLCAQPHRCDLNSLGVHGLSAATQHVWPNGARWPASLLQPVGFTNATTSSNAWYHHQVPMLTAGEDQPPQTCIPDQASQKKKSANMRRQRNNSEMKELGEWPEKEINEVVVSNLSDRIQTNGYMDAQTT